MNNAAYWDAAALDPAVDKKYICDVSITSCRQDLEHIIGRDVLEIGCGVGRLLRRGWHGVDISRNMLDIAEARKPSCHYKLLRELKLPYDNNSFNHVYSYLVFQHLKINEITAYIHEAYRVLRQNGMFTFQFIAGDEAEPLSNHYDPEVLQSLLQVADFTEVTMTNSYAHPLWRIMKAVK